MNIEKKIEEILRVDHAGEYGAIRIYEGQLKGLYARQKFFEKKDMHFSPDEEIEEIEHMRQQEEKHLEFFSEMLLKHKKMNTALLPLWHMCGYSFGFLSGFLGKNFAMSMTKAVEEVIDEHYLKQISYLEKIDYETDFKNELLENLKKFRQEEIDHMNYAEDYNRQSFENNSSPGNIKKQALKFGSKIFEKMTKIGCHTAIFLSKKI